MMLQHFYTGLRLVEFQMFTLGDRAICDSQSVLAAVGGETRSCTGHCGKYSGFI